MEGTQGGLHDQTFGQGKSTEQKNCFGVGMSSQIGQRGDSLPWQISRLLNGSLINMPHRCANANSDDFDRLPQDFLQKPHFFKEQLFSC